MRYKKTASFLFFVLSTFAILCVSAKNSIANSSNIENKLVNLYLRILENGVDVFEPLFTEKHTKAPDSGFYDFREYKNWTHPRNEPYHTLCMIPGNGQVVLTYAVLLRYTDKKEFGILKHSREILFNHARKTIRWICLTSIYVDSPYPFLSEVREDLASGKQWHRKYGLRQDLLGYLSIGVALLWNDLDNDTRDLFKKVAIGGALRERIVRTANESGNGNHDQVKQDLASTIAAAYLFPDHPEHSKFMEGVTGAGLDLVSTVRDFSSNSFVGESRLKELARGWNLNSDYSSFHHNHPSLWYGVEKIFEGRFFVEILSKLTKIAVPATYSYAGNGFDGVYRYATILTTQDGVMMHLRSPEYDCCYGEGLLAFCYGNLIKMDPLGADLELKAANILQRNSKALGQFDYHRCSWAKAAIAFLSHRLHGEGLFTINYNDLYHDMEGVYEFQTLRAFVHRSAKAWMGFIWGTNGQAGGGGPGAYVVPSETGGPMIYNTSDGLVGSLLIHRPNWMYLSLLSFSILIICSGLFFVRKNNHFLSDLFLFFAVTLLVAIILVAWIDFDNTLVLRIPRAEIPRWVFPALSLLATTIAGLSILVSKTNYKITFNSPIFWGKVISLAIMVIPISLLLMMRTPWIDIFKGEYLFEKPFFHFIGVLLCLIALYQFKEAGIRKKLVIWLIFVLWLIAFAIFLYVFSFKNEDHYYLRLISIRNLRRVILAFGVGIGLLIFCLFSKFYVPKMKQLNVILRTSIVVLVAGFSVALLSIGRFDLPKIGKISYEVSDNGFSTAGEFITSGVNQKQAFFSFDNGLSILFLDIKGTKNSLISYSGLKVPFYQRDGFIPLRYVSYSGGNEPIFRLQGQLSRWWSVDGDLGLVFAGGEPVISGSRQIGENWARTEDYLDRMDVIFSSPLKVRRLKKGRSLIKLTAGIYSGFKEEEIKEYAQSYRELKEIDMPEGWMGVIAPMGKNGLAFGIANLGERADQTELKLSWDGWAPVFSVSGTVYDSKLKLPLKLECFETFKDVAQLLICNDSGAPFEVVKIGIGKYKISPVLLGPCSLRMRWIGPTLSGVLKENSFGLEGVPAKSFFSDEGYEAIIDGSTSFYFLSDDFQDNTPPFVGVEMPTIDGNGNLVVEVKANDRSGVSSVMLYMDDKRIGEKKVSPFKWEVPQTHNYHSFYAKAVDNSVKKNIRYSFITSWVRK